jgi:DNA polymerase III alpha subunit
MDIDIDVPNRDQILSVIPHVPAAAIREGIKIDKHNSGVYFQNIPVDPETGYSAIDFNDAEELGYMKFDFLNNTIYSNVKDPDHLDSLVNKEPLWDLFESEEIVSQLHHIHNYFDLTKKFKPQSLDELAALIALIRPGKRYLQDKLKSYIMEHIWDKEEEGYTFKKSHSYAYALSIIVQLNLIVEDLSNEV